MTGAGPGIVRPLAVGVCALLAVVTLLTAAAGAGLAALTGADAATTTMAPSGAALAAIPAGYLALYQQAAATCPGLPWTVLAAIGTIESANGANPATSSAGAVGPMQFLPSTWAAYRRDGDGDGRADIHDRADAIYTAAAYLCANGARHGANIPGAIFAYNHAAWYVSDVLTLAVRYGSVTGTGAGAGHVGKVAIAFATAHIGTPYRWGGDSPGGFDCSGLTYAAYAAARIAIPRTAEQQWAQLPHVPLDELRPGDLVFFNLGEFLPGLPGHVGLYLGHGFMIDAPHTGAHVRIEPLLGFGDLVGATRPGQ